MYLHEEKKKRRRKTNNFDPIPTVNSLSFVRLIQRRNRSGDNTKYAEQRSINTTKSMYLVFDFSFVSVGSFNVELTLLISSLVFLFI